MTTTPNLPPLPWIDVQMAKKVPFGYAPEQVETIRSDAYQAGRDAGLEEALQAVCDVTCPCCYSEQQQATAEECADAIRALKSDAREASG